MDRRRILLVAPKAPPYGGMALQAGQLVRLLAAEGHDVHLLPANIELPWALRVFDRIRGVRPFVRSTVICAHLLRELPRCDVAHVLAASWLYFFLVVAPAVLLGRLFGKRVVLNYRSGEGPQFFAQYGWMASPIVRLAGAVTAPSAFLAESIGRHAGVPVSIVNNVVDLSRFRFRERKRFAPRLLVTRHLEKLYGVETVLEAFREIQARYPDASLDIAGTGSQRARLERLTADWGLLGVRFLGQVPHAQMGALYENTDILLNGSFADNFPGSLIEASACGLAVVSTNAGGIAFVYENGRNAMLAEPGDWRGLAAGVMGVVGDPALGERLTAAAAELCRSCEWSTVREQMYRTYGFSETAAPEAALGAVR